MYDIYLLTKLHIIYWFVFLCNIYDLDVLFFLIFRVRVEFFTNEKSLKERLQLYFIKNQRSSMLPLLWLRFKSFLKLASKRDLTMNDQKSCLSNILICIKDESFNRYQLIFLLYGYFGVLIHVGQCSWICCQNFDGALVSIF